MFRALQHDKTDDLPVIESLLDQTEGAVLDICSGIGRSSEPALRRGRAVTAIDVDTDALVALRVRYPRVETQMWDLSRAAVPHPTREPVHLALCAHHAANEVRRMDTVFETARNGLAQGGLFYLDVLTSNYDKPGQIEVVRTFGHSEQGYWTLHTAVLPHEGWAHTLILIGTYHDANGQVLRTLTHPLPRLNFPVEEVLAEAERAGFACKERFTPNRFLFAKQ